MNSFLDKIYWGNTVQSYLVAIAGIFITWVIIRTLRRVVLKRVDKWISKTDNTYDDIILKVVEKFVLPYVYLLINFQIIQELYMHPRLRKILIVAMAVVTMYFMVRLINHALQLAVNGYMRRRNETAERIRQLNGVMIVIKALVWFVGFIFLLGNLGYDVRTMIAGLGVGGIAIALAAQTVLGDLFSYFVIFFDKPFEIGDFVKAGDSMGIIEQIGIKTTRIRSLDGEQLVMSNTNLTSSTIRNYKRLEKRRVVTVIGVTYKTKSEHLKQIPVMIKDIIEANADTVFDRSHLSKLDAYSINFETIYTIQTADFGRYMDIQQAVLLAIIEGFEARGIEFAFPTQTVVLDNPIKAEISEGSTHDSKPIGTETTHDSRPIGTATTNDSKPIGTGTNP